MSDSENTTTPETAEEQDSRPRLGRRKKNPDSVRTCRVGLVLSAERMRSLKGWLEADTEERSANEAIQAILFREIAAWEEAGRPPHDSASGPFAAAGKTAARETSSAVPGDESAQMRRSRERKMIAKLLGEEAAEALKLWKDNTRKADYKRRLFAAVENGTSCTFPSAAWEAYAEKHGEDAANTARAALAERMNADPRGEGHAE